jgi:hypothetical protein
MDYPFTNEVIKRLGGTVKAAEFFVVRPTTISWMRKHGMSSDKFRLLRRDKSTKVKKLIEGLDDLMEVEFDVKTGRRRK